MLEFFFFKQKTAYEIGRGVVLVGVSLVGPEQVVNDDGSPVPENTRSVVGVLAEAISSHDSFINGCRVRLSTQLSVLRFAGARIRMTPGTEEW